MLDRHDCFNVDVRSPTRNESFAQTFSKCVLQIHASFVRRGVSQSVEESEKMFFTLLKQGGVLGVLNHKGPESVATCVRLVKTSIFIYTSLSIVARLGSGLRVQGLGLGLEFRV